MSNEDLEDFRLLGHDCPVGRYPAPVVPIGRLGGRLIAIYRSERGSPEPVVIPEQAKFVKHNTEVSSTLESFNAATDLLFATSPDVVVSYDAQSEDTHLLLFRQANDDPFYRLALSGATDQVDIILQDLIDCLKNIVSTAPELAESWYYNWRSRLQSHRFAPNLPPDFNSFLNLKGISESSRSQFQVRKLPEPVRDFLESQPLIRLLDIRKVFYTDEVETHALQNINLSIGRGEFVAVTGPSGSGKSTLLSILGLLDTPTGGLYVLNDRQVETLNFSERSRIRNQEIGFIFQSFNLIGDLTVQENVALPLTYRVGMPESERNSRVKQALERVNMEHRSRHYPAQLSGGQQQRVAIARAVAGSPSILLADEPTGNLDSKNGESVMRLLTELHQEGSTICVVTHDRRVLRFANRIIGVHDGRIVDESEIPILVPSF